MRNSSPSNSDKPISQKAMDFQRSVNSSDMRIKEYDPSFVISNCSQIEIVERGVFFNEHIQVANYDKTD